MLGVIPKFELCQTNAASAQAAFESLGASLPMMAISLTDIGDLVEFNRDLNPYNENLTRHQLEVYAALANEIIRFVSPNQTCIAIATTGDFDGNFSYDTHLDGHEGIVSVEAMHSDTRKAHDGSWHIDSHRANNKGPVYGLHLTTDGAGEVRAANGLYSPLNKYFDFTAKVDPTHARQFDQFDAHIFLRQGFKSREGEVIAPAAHSFRTTGSSRSYITSHFGFAIDWTTAA